jgi:hypothetical protein
MFTFVGSFKFFVLCFLLCLSSFFVMCPMLSMSLDCTFNIVLSVFSHVYLCKITKKKHLIQECHNLVPKNTVSINMMTYKGIKQHQNMHNRFNPAKFVCLSQDTIWFSNVIMSWYFLCSVSSVKMSSYFSLYWYWWNCVNFSFHNKSMRIDYLKQYSSPALFIRAVYVQHIIILKLKSKRPVVNCIDQ